MLSSKTKLVLKLSCNTLYSMKQSDQDSLKTDTFHKPTTYEPYVCTSFEETIPFFTHEYGRVGVFRITMRSLDQKV